MSTTCSPRTLIVVAETSALRYLAAVIRYRDAEWKSKRRGLLSLWCRLTLPLHSNAVIDRWTELKSATNALSSAGMDWKARAMIREVRRSAAETWPVKSPLIVLPHYPPKGDSTRW